MTNAGSGARLWIIGARPRTLPAAVVPVCVGTATVAAETLVPWRFAAAMVVALALQVATNYANDYSDGVRGTDEDRVGPLRLVGSGAASPGAVKRAMFAAFAVAAAVGLLLAVAVTPWLIVVGVLSIAAGWFYTGGPNPYGYLGLGEVFVFVFFGLVATVGSAFVQVERIDETALALAVPVGLLATALLVVNNLRDRSGDAGAGKRTVAVRIGDRATRALYLAMVLGAFVVVAAVAVAGDRGWVALGLLGAIPVAPAVRVVLQGAEGRPLISALEATGQAHLVTGLGLSVGLII